MPKICFRRQFEFSKLPYSMSEMNVGGSVDLAFHASFLSNSEQSYSFLAMPTPIPQILSPYLSSLSTGSLLLVTSVLNAPANWLVLRCMLAALHRDQNAHHLDQHDTTQGSNSSRVVLLSFIRPLGLWAEIGKKAVREARSCRTLLCSIEVSDTSGRVWTFRPSLRTDEYSTSMALIFTDHPHHQIDQQGRLQHAPMR